MRAPATKFGERLRAYRKKYALSCQDLGEVVGVHASYIGQMESGANRRGPSVALIYRLAAVMGEDASELMKLAGKADEVQLRQEVTWLRRRVVELEKQLSEYKGPSR